MNNCDFNYDLILSIYYASVYNKSHAQLQRTSDKKKNEMKTYQLSYRLHNCVLLRVR